MRLLASHVGVTRAFVGVEGVTACDGEIRIVDARVEIIARVKIFLTLELLK